MQYLVDDFIRMNQAGQVLELCEKYYHDGELFSQSMSEAYEIQKGFVAAIESIDIQLISQHLNGNISELVFLYKMIGNDETLNEFTGKHIQTWQDNKIIHEEYLTV